MSSNDDGRRRAKTSSQSSKRNNRETSSSKRSASSKINRTTNATSATLDKYKKHGSSGKTPTSKSPSANRKSGLRGRKNAFNMGDTDSTEMAEQNDSVRQDLTSRGLSIVPTDIFDLITLRRLVLANNNISSLPANIRVLVNLEYLDISRNPLRAKNGIDDYTCIPREFNQLRNLHTLIMAECTLKQIPVAVWNTISIQTLDISRNKVGFIVGDIGNLSDIRHLRLSQMDLDTLPPEIGFCDKLETIDLTGNPIDNLPETLVECRQLYEFKINYKTFYKLLDNYMLELIDEGKIRSEHIPQVIYELESLLVLDLNHTKLNFISNEHTLLNLNELYLAHNSFTDIPESLSTMDQLKLLDMSHNRIQNIPEHFIKIKRLEILNLSNNNLTILPSNIAQLTTLKKLIVSHNQIDTIETGFSQSQSLTGLDLSYNKLTFVSDEICYLKNLETLDLRYNQLVSLPLSMRHITGLKKMHMFDDRFQRFGLHLSGNSITDPPSHIWKGTSVKNLFDYMETKEKRLLNNFYHLKLILLGPKNIGKTTLSIKLINNHKMISNTRKTLDMYVSILQERRLELNKDDSPQELSDIASSVLTDEWIENRVSSSNNENFLNRKEKIKRVYPPPLTTYQSSDLFENYINKSTIITKNNLYCTIFDLTSEPNFEILNPLIYDSNALFILPINLTILLNIVQAASSLDNFDENDNNISIIDYDALLTDDWLYFHIFRYIESISNYCSQASIAIIGLIKNYQLASNDQQQQLLDEIHSKVNMFLTDEENQRTNITLYSELFSEPIHLDNNDMSDVIETFEIISQQWNIVHHKEKRQILKRKLGFMAQDSLTIDYDICFKDFQKQNGTLSASSSDDNEEQKTEITEETEQTEGKEQEENNDGEEEVEEEEKNEIVENEINQMTFDECLDYLKITGDIIYFNQGSQKIILIKPYYLLNNVLSRTVFRPHIDQWLNYDENMIFHFGGYYPTKELFDIDRQRLLTRGEYTWKMLSILFKEQNNSTHNLVEQNLIDYCRLMERLYLGYVNESNLNYQEFTTLYFICPWLMNEKSSDIDYKDYFKLLEQNRIYEHLKCERTRKIKQQKLWFAADIKKAHIPNVDLIQENVDKSTDDQFPKIDDLPLINEIEVSNSQIINQGKMETFKIVNENSNFLPNGLYERLLICLHALFYERLDYYNITIGRTVEKNLIKIERSDTETEINITISSYLLETIQNLLIQNLFSFYPTINLRIET
ncbi:unnamed protein product [Adineta steineri]|uniref:Uncharacterized protein n=1 Tax=Adineta steineri TaxID=433720 RepID=A0A818PAU2_9BILA|nr:unnamed protein product [Adineta steineri]CAF3621284.1 unnamed protein product [Adineta steineri]